MITFTKKAQYRAVILKSELSDLLKEVQSIQDYKDKYPIHVKIGRKEFEIRSHEKLYEGVI